ncbi:hypothetical protein Y695_03857 [Hydrogenophaga sp. T4]|nr:hypothetical protein Y695_03857 [Hydrogenophaga sp. T4]
MTALCPCNDKAPLSPAFHRVCTSSRHPLSISPTGDPCDDFLRGPRHPAPGRPPLLPPPPHQPGAAFRQRDQFPRGLRVVAGGPGGLGADRLAGLHGHAPGGPFLLRAQGLRPHQPGLARTQGSHQGGLQPAAQGRADGLVGRGAGGAAGLTQPAGLDRAAQRLDRLCARRRRGLAGDRGRWPAVPHRAPVLHPRCADRPGVDDQDPDRPFPRHRAVPQGPAATDAWRAARPGLPRQRG